MTWIEQLVQQHAELESPKSFWYWAGLATISAIVKDNVWLTEGGAWNLYPNIYVILYADSGVGKGAPIALAQKLVRNVNNTRIVSGRSSIQGILRKLGSAETRPGGKVNAKSTGFIVASEFSSALVRDPAAMDILTDLFDRIWRAGDWDSLLKNEEFQLKDPTISLLAGINEAHFDALMDSKDIYGGFLGRTFLIRETQVNKLNPLIDDLINPPQTDELLVHLRELSKVKGPFKSLARTAAGELYKEWYLQFYRTVQDQQIQDKTGTIQRVRDAVKKVAMLLSLSRGMDLTITEKEMEEAIERCEKLVGNVRKMTYGKKGLSSSAEQKAIVIDELMQRPDHRVSRTMLLKKNWMHFDSAELDEMMKTFEAAGTIRAMSIGNQVVYEMPNKVVEEFQRFLSGKNE